MKCPNAKWTYDSESGKCQPLDFEVTCNSDHMEVSLFYLHLYSSLKEAQIDQSTSSAWAGSCKDTSVSSVNGTYTVKIPFDDCSTVIEQSNGTLTVSNTIYGNPEALQGNDIIRMVSLLQIPVTCSYIDTYETSMTTTVGEYTDVGIDEGDAASLAQFQIEPFLDSGFQQAINGSNPAVIGEPIFLRISPTKSLPENLPFVVTNCFAKVGLK